MSDQGFTQADVEALATKLASMDFSDHERAILGFVFDAAVGNEVQGFAWGVPSMFAPVKTTTTPPPGDSGGGKVKTYDFSRDT